MEIWMSGEIQDDVIDDFRHARNDVESTLNAALRDRQYGDPIKQWALIPIILPGEDERLDEVRKFDKRRRVVEFRLKIHHETFKSATPAAQRSLICACLLRSIDLFPTLHVGGFDHEAFCTDVERVAAEKGWLDPTLRSEQGLNQTVEGIARQRIAVGVQFGGESLESSRIAEAIDSIRKAAVALQSGFEEGSEPAIKVVYCVAGPDASPDWDHGRVTGYSEGQKRVRIEAAVPTEVVESESPLDYLIGELQGANALAFEFYRQNGERYPVAEADRLVARIRDLAAAKLSQ
jgi:hypothetical protein